MNLQESVVAGALVAPDDLESVAEWMRKPVAELSFERRDMPISVFAKQIQEMHQSYDQFPQEAARTNRIIKELKSGSKPFAVFVEKDDPHLFVIEGRHRIVAMWLLKHKTISVIFVS